MLTRIKSRMVLWLRGRRLRQHLIFVLGLLTLAGGMVWSRQAARQSDLALRQDMLRQVVALANAINPAELEALSFTVADLERPEYRRLCAHLRHYARPLGWRSIYIMAQHDRQIVFGPESLAPNDPYASTPGTVYRQAHPDDYRIFSDGLARTLGPRTDEYGTFLMASAPIFHPRSDVVQWVVGLDLDVADWRDLLNRARRLPLALTAIILTLLMLADRLSRRQLLILATRRYPHAAVVATTAGLLLTLTLALVRMVHPMEVRSRQTDFSGLSMLLSGTLNAGFKSLQTDLAALRSFFESCEDVTSEEFARFISGRDPFLQATDWFWAPDVPAREATSFEHAVRRAYHPDYAIRAQPETDLATAPAVSDMLNPILYLAPPGQAWLHPGDNLGDDETFRHALAEARATGMPTATPPFDRFSANNPPTQLCAFQRVVSGLRQGYIGCAIDLRQLIEDQLRRGGLRDSGVAIGLFQAGPEGKLQLIAQSGDHGDEQIWRQRNRLLLAVPTFLFGQTFVLRMHPKPGWLMARPLRLTQLTGVFGCVLSLGLTIMIASLLNRPIRLDRMMRQRTAELLESQTRLRAVLESIPDPIWLKDPQGVYLACNPAFARLHGRTPEQVVGKTDRDFASPGAHGARPDRPSPLGKRDGPMTQEEWLGTAHGGMRRLFEVVQTPIRDDSDRVIWGLGIAHDITDRKSADAILREQADELVARNADLERLAQAAVDRELRMIELKKEINALRAQVDDPHRYRLPTDIAPTPQPGKPATPGHTWWRRLTRKANDA